MYNGYEINFFEDANGFIAKYADSGSFAQLVWELEFDIDDSVTAIGTQTQREFFPGDVKKQECLYSITQNSDGGYTAAGNCSPNLDDGYLVNFKGDCGFDKNYTIDHYQWDDLFITSNVTWDSAHFNSSTASIRGVVIVDNGGTLTIDGMLMEFADTRSCGYQTNITVLEGGHLFVKNSTLTSSSDCDPNACWDGIQVRGDNEESHNTTDQGKITLKNCTIQNSSSGICLGRKEYRKNLYWAETQTMGGGIIHADSSVFLNNRFSIHFSPYFYSITNPYSNTSYFANCDFINSAPIPAYGELGMSNFVSILEVRDINFLGCHFKNTMAEAVDSAMGSAIGGFNCGFKVDSSPYRTSLFSGLRYGIEAGQSNLTAAAFPIDIRNTLFAKNWRAIYLTNSHWPIIAQNEFRVGFTGINLSHGNSYGLYLHNCQEYKIEDNLFFDNGNVESTGLLVYNTTEDSLSNRIYANSFERFLIASIGMNQNRGYDEFTGLKFLCNDYTDNAYAIQAGWGNQPGISELQGIKTVTGGGGYDYTSAGNCFNGCTQSDGYFYNDADSIHYIEHITDDCRKLSKFPACYTSSDIFVTTLTKNESINRCNEFEHTDDRPSRDQDPVKFLEDEIFDLEKKQFAISPNSIEYENLEALKDQFIGQAVTSAIRQKNNEGLEKSIELLRKSDKWSRKISLADLLTQNGQYDEALSILLELEREYDHLSSWVNLKMIMLEYVRTKMARSEIREDPKAMEIINYLTSDFSLYGSMSARVLLAELNGTRIPEVFPSKPLPTKKEVSPEITSDVKAVIKCFPNPFTNEVNIYVDLKDSYPGSELVIYDMNGTQQYREILQKGKRIINISGKLLPAGLYIAHLRNGRDIDERIKIVHSK